MDEYCIINDSMIHKIKRPPPLDLECPEDPGTGQVYICNSLDCPVHGARNRKWQDDLKWLGERKYKCCGIDAIPKYMGIIRAHECPTCGTIYYEPRT